MPASEKLIVDGQTDQVVFRLGPGDAAIVFRADGDDEIVVPDFVDDNAVTVDSPTWRAIAAVLFLRDEELRDAVEEKFLGEAVLSRLR